MINTDLIDTQVLNIMSKDTKCVKPLTLMKEVDEIFSCSDFHHLPVVDDNDKLLGMVSKYDLQLIKQWGLKKALPNAQRLNDLVLNSQYVKDWMTEDLVTVTSSDSLEYCALAFKENRFHSLPVVDNDKLTGIITTYDLIVAAYL